MSKSNDLISTLQKSNKVVEETKVKYLFIFKYKLLNL